MEQDSDLDVPRQEETRLLAYQFWQERGSPFGTPEVDWFLAENEVRHPAKESPLVAAAKTVGAVVGSVAAMVAAVAGGTSKDT